MLFETIGDEAELGVAKSLAADAFGRGDPSLHEELKSVIQTPHSLSAEASKLLTAELIHATQTREGMDGGVTSTIADGILRRAGINLG